MKPWVCAIGQRGMRSLTYVLLIQIFTLGLLYTGFMEVSYTSISQSGLELYRANDSGQSHLLAVLLIGIMRYSQDQLG